MSETCIVGDDDDDDNANVKRRLRSKGVSLRSGFPSEMYLTASSIHSSRGMLVNKLSTSKEMRNLPNMGKLLIS